MAWHGNLQIQKLTIFSPSSTNQSFVYKAIFCLHSILDSHLMSWWKSTNGNRTHRASSSEAKNFLEPCNSNRKVHVWMLSVQQTLFIHPACSKHNSVDNNSSVVLQNALQHWSCCSTSLETWSKFSHRKPGHFLRRQNYAL